jgi:hypothetical protein
MTQQERETELNRIKTARGYTIHTADTVVSGNTTSSPSVPPASARTPASMTISYTAAANPGINPSVVSSLPGYPANFSVLPHVVSENNSAPAGLTI